MSAPQPSYEQASWPPATQPNSPVPAAPTSPATYPAPRVPERPGKLTAAEAFWYVLGCIAFAGSYFCKVPVKKALEEYGYGSVTAWEKFWYVLMCIGFGAGYFAKVPIKKAFAESLSTREV
jgi:hypothetical protein